MKEAILKPALRAIQQETNFSPAQNSDYIEAFDKLLEMLEFWQSRGIILFDSPPPNMNAGLSDADPSYTLWTNLVMHIASHFNYNPKPLQGSQAQQSFRVLQNRQKGKACMNRPSNMPRGSGNTWYRNWVCLDDCDEQFITDTDAPFITGT